MHLKPFQTHGLILFWIMPKKESSLLFQQQHKQMRLPGTVIQQPLFMITLGIPQILQKFTVTT